MMRYDRRRVNYLKKEKWDEKKEGKGVEESRISEIGGSLSTQRTQE